MAIDATRPLAALFDLDGVIFDTEPTYTGFWGDIARKYRPDVKDLEYLIKGTTLPHIFAEYFPDVSMQKEISRQLLDFEASMPFVYVPGTKDFIEELHRNGVRTAVVTSSSRTKMQAVHSSHPEMDCLFDRILTSEDFTRSKPDPECYLTGASAFSAPISNCMVFEDSLNGLASGHSSGIFTVGLTTSNKKEQIYHLCDYICDDFTNFSFDLMLKLLQNR